MPNEIALLDDKEQAFINYLVEGNTNEKAAELAGYYPHYGHRLRKRLAKYIVDAAEDYLSTEAIKAARKVVDSIDAEMPNAINLAAANSLLDRVGIIKKDINSVTANIKANIFILPEKKPIQIIDVEDE